MKKTIAYFIFPYRIGLLLILTGALLLWFSRKQKAGKVFVSIGLGLLVIVSLKVVSDPMLSRLENRYPPLIHVNHLKNVPWVVVLSGGAYPAGDLPILDRLSKESLTRLAEGIRILNLLEPPAKIVLSGGNPTGSVVESQVMSQAAVALGLDADKIVIEDQSRDSKDQARFVKDIIGGDTFILVTSANHMPRAAALFTKQGLTPIPAPAGVIVKDRDSLSPTAILPGSGSLGRTERAIYEYLGIAWAWLRGQV